MKRLFLLIALAALPAIINAQTFTMTGSSASFYNAGTFTLVNDIGKFRTDADAVGNVDNSGTIEFRGTDNQFTDVATEDPDGAGALGAADDRRITGEVFYHDLDPNNENNVQNRYYTNLRAGGVANGELNFPDAVYVGASYFITGDAARDYDVNSNSFVYDGSSGTQTIAGEDQTLARNGYHGLYFTNGALKRLDAGETARAADNIEMAASASGGVTVNGTMIATNNFNIFDSGAEFFVNSVGTENASLSFGGGTTNIDGELVVEETGTGSAQVFTGTDVATVNSNGSVVVNSGTFNATGNGGDLTLAGGGSSFTVADAGNITVGASRTFTINGGGFVNGEATVANRNNMNFDDASYVVYNNGGDVVNTNETNGYGSLVLQGTAQSSENANSTIYVSEDFAVLDNDFTLATGANTSGTLYMTDDTGIASYTNDTELIGTMARTVSGSSSTLTFNNEYTTVDFLNGGIGTNTEIAIDTRPSADTDYTGALITDFDAATDVDRSLRVYNNGTGATMNIAYGYRESEIDDPTLDNTLRFREDIGGNESEKVSTGEIYSRDIDGPNWNSVYLRGIVQEGDNSAPTGQLAQIAEGGVLFLRGGPAVYISVNSGRWSNPDTWDEGEQPGPEDMAVVRHTVHAGYNRPDVDGIQPDEDTRLATFGESTNTAFIGKIILDETYAGIAATEAATLILGGDKTYQTNPSDTDLDAAGWGEGEFANAGGIEIEGTNNFTTLPVDQAETEGNGNDYNNGMVIFAGATLFIDGNVIVDNNQWNNSGSVELNEDGN